MIAMVVAGLVGTAAGMAGSILAIRSVIRDLAAAQQASAERLADLTSRMATTPPRRARAELTP